MEIFVAGCPVAMKTPSMSTPQFNFYEMKLSKLSVVKESSGIDENAIVKEHYGKLLPFTKILKLKDRDKGEANDKICWLHTEKRREMGPLKGQGSDADIKVAVQKCRNDVLAENDEMQYRSRFLSSPLHNSCKQIQGRKWINWVLGIGVRSMTFNLNSFKRSRDSQARKVLKFRYGQTRWRLRKK